MEAASEIEEEDLTKRAEEAVIAYSVEEALNLYEQVAKSYLNQEFLAKAANAYGFLTSNYLSNQWVKEQNNSSSLHSIGFTNPYLSNCTVLFIGICNMLISPIPLEIDPSGLRIDAFMYSFSGTQ